MTEICPSPPVASVKERLDWVAMAILVVLCASWGLAQVSIKVANTGVSPVLQGGLRSLMAGLLVAGWMLVRGQPIFVADGTLWWGLAIGTLFSLEFFLIYWGLAFTTASRSVVFLYTMPFYVALGAHWLIPGERLVPAQVLGLAGAFLGIVVAFGESLTLTSGKVLMGDLLVAIGAIGWAAVTVMIKISPLARIAPAKTLLYQLAVSALLLPIGSLLLGETGITRLSPLVVVCVLYQGIWVAFITYLAWFWLICRYPASRLAAFMFLTPLLGVAAGAILIDEPVTPFLLVALLMVCCGIYLVNRSRDRRR